MTDFVHLIGAAYPEGFVTNELSAFGRPSPCPQCGRLGGDEDRPLAGKLVVDERRFDPHEELPDLLNLYNGGLLVSRRFAAALSTLGVRGQRLHPVFVAETGEPSQRHFILQASRTIAQGCLQHGRATKLACATCGAGGGSRSAWHVEDALVDELDMFSLHRWGMADIGWSHELIEELEKSFDLCVIEGPVRCRHAARPARVWAAPSLPSDDGPPLPRCTVEQFLYLVQQPNPRVQCTRQVRGKVLAHTFEVSHRIESGASPAELARLERQLPEVAHLRPLFSRANGLVLFHQGALPVFPTRAAIRESRGALDVAGALRFEKASEWRQLRRDMLASPDLLHGAFFLEQGIPFASILGSADQLVSANGKIYYFSPGANRYHNQLIAGSLAELLGILTTDLATFLLETASVTTYYDGRGAQYSPRSFSY